MPPLEDPNVRSSLIFVGLPANGVVTRRGSVPSECRRLTASLGSSSAKRTPLEVRNSLEALLAESPLTVRAGAGSPADTGAAPAGGLSLPVESEILVLSLRCLSSRNKSDGDEPSCSGGAAAVGGRT